MILGNARYLGDIGVEGALHAAFARSPVAHASMGTIHVDEARAAPGVRAVYVADDLALPDIPGNTGRGPEAEHMTRPVLARGRVRHVGEPIALVIASTPVQAVDAAELVWADLDEQPSVPDAEAALTGDVLLHPGAGTNVVERTRLEAGEPVADPALSVTVEIESQRLAPTPIEPLGILVTSGPSGLVVWCGHQAPHRLQRQLARFLGREPDSVRVVVPDVGGAFGMKGMLYPEYIAVAASAERLGETVAWVQRRRELFASGTHGRAQSHVVTVDGDLDGRIRALRIEILADVGAYPHNGAQIPRFTRFVSPGLYDIGRLEVDLTTVVTNRAPIGSYRGAGRPEAALALEHSIDAFARAGGLDPIEVRLRNLVPPESLPRESPTGARYDSGDYPAALRAALEELDLPGLREEQGRRLEQGDDLLGIGLAAFVERAGGAVDSGEYGAIEVDAAGRRLIVRTGSTDTGQGHAPIWRRLVTDVFGIDSISVVSSDTAEVSDGVGSFGSRSAQIGASAVFRTAGRLLEAARERAARHLEAAPEDIEYREGEFGVVGSPGESVSLWALAEEEPLFAEEMFVPGAQTFPYGVHAAVVEVGRETGEVRVRRIVAIDDCGQVLDPETVEGQLMGSLAQGLGQALFEEVRYDDRGQPLTTTLMDYLVPHATDMPPVTAGRLVSPAPSNPLGVKGVGETGCIGLPPAILNAAVDALAPLGVTHLDLPLTPSRVWKAMARAQEHP